MKKVILTGFSVFLLIASALSQSLQEARKLTDNEQFESATIMFQSLITQAPSNVNLFFYYGYNLLLSDNDDSAKIIFDKGKALDPKNSLIKIGNAMILLDIIDMREMKASSEKDNGNKDLRNLFEKSSSNVKEANALIDEATLNTKDINVLIEAANALIHFKNKDVEKAKTFLDKAMAMDTKNIEVLLLYGDIYTELNNGTLAAEYYNKALDLNKTSARAIVSKGKLYKRSTNYEGAEQEFKNAIAVEPSYAPAHRELGEIYIKLGKLSEAKEEYKKYLEISKNNCGARIRYASFLYASKNYSEALTELMQVQQRCDSNNLTMLRIQSYCYYETHDTAKGLLAINHLFHLLAPDNRSSKDIEYHGKFLIASDKDSVERIGIDELKKAISLDPTRSDLLFDEANAWMKLKQYDKAIEVLNQKIALGKDVKAADYYNLGRAYYYNQQFAEADSAFQKVNELSPKYATGYLWRAESNSHIDTTSEAGLAKPYYEKYIEIARNDSANISKYQNGLIEAYGYLAYYYILKKDNQNGLIYLKKKLELPLDPEDRKHVQQAIDQLEGKGPKQK